MSIVESIDPDLATAEERRLAAHLKELRLGNGIGSKWLRLVIAKHHVEVASLRDFVFDVEYSRIRPTPALVQAWSDAVTETLARPADAPTIPCPCDLCGHPTRSWLYDTCDSCIRSFVCVSAKGPQ